MIYAHFNMLSPSYQKMGTFDLIFCNYSLIYFDLKHQKDIITKLAKNLNQNGILVLDPASALKVDHPQLKLISFNHHSFFRKVHDA
jgi:chemotaxis protein methyltransferase CheR